MRAVTADHVMFNECIPMFRPEKIQINEEGNQIIGYLLLDFFLTETLNFSYFSIQPSIEVKLPGAYSAFVTPVILPKWFEGYHNAHLFTIGLASVVSFVTGRPVKAPRDGYTSYREQLDELSLGELAVQFPILTAGPGSHLTNISSEATVKIFESLNDFIEMLFELPFSEYKKVMQSIRLVHLAHNNTREDFALSYYLLVSSIETVAQIATKVRDFKKKHENEDDWKRLAKESAAVEQLFSAYKEANSKNKFLNERFVQFIKDYCPYERWELLEHPYEDYDRYISDITDHSQKSNIAEKHWFEKYPSDLSEEYLEQIIKDMYKHRSKFTHQGVNPPHRDQNSFNKFFEEVTDYDLNGTDENGFVTIKKILLPNIRLVSFIARDSIINYYKLKVGKEEG